MNITATTSICASLPDLLHVLTKHVKHEHFWASTYKPFKQPPAVHASILLQGALHTFVASLLRTAPETAS